MALTVSLISETGEFFGAQKLGCNAMASDVTMFPLATCGDP